MNFTDLLAQVKTQEQYANILNIIQNIDKVKRYAKKHKLNEKEVMDTFFTEAELKFYATVVNSNNINNVYHSMTKEIINTYHSKLSFDTMGLYHTATS